MSTDMKPASAASFGATLLYAAALAGVLVLVGSIRSEASSFEFIGPSISSHVFTFDDPDYTFELAFSGLAANADFTVTVDDNVTTQADVLDEGRLNNNSLFNGYTCVPIADGISDCVDFSVTGAPEKGPATYDFFDITVRWFPNTNGLFSNEPGNRIRILHNRGDVEGEGFDTDITFGPYDPGCFECDPSIGGRDDNFQSFMVFQATEAVPEPATMFLLGSGLIGAIHQRRRRLKSLSPSAQTPRG